jgi:hypothetical protein
MAALAQRFVAVAKFFTEKREREVARYDQFLAFYEHLIRETPVPAVQRFRGLDINVQTEGKTETWSLHLTPTDFGFWKAKIADGARFTSGPDAVELAIMNRMAGFAEQLSLSREDRAALLDILQDRQP